jgi:acetyltransferase-like isoleucine patch superfamily enzyme
VEPNGGLAPEHRERLRAAGADAAAVDALRWRLVEDGVPAWWHDCGNALYLADGALLPPQVLEQLTLFPVRDVVVAVGSALRSIASLLVGGDGATVYVDAGCEITAGELFCGGGSSIVLHGPLVATRCAVVDARNGGSVVAGPEQLWAADVYVATDDMHRLEDRATGERINPFGASIRLGRHVWLCKDAVVTGHADVGDGAVVAMRSVVRGQKVPAHSVVAGVPARVVRDDVAWSYDDRP